MVLQTFALATFAQKQYWSLDSCITYALDKSVSIQKSQLSIQTNEENYKQSKDERLPSLQAFVSHNSGLSRDLISSTSYGTLVGTSSTSYGLNTDVTLFNGFKMKNQIEQQGLNVEAGKYYLQYVVESLELNILNAYMQVLYSIDEVNNAEEQLVATNEQLRLAAERKELGLISKADYLQIKSELATEKLTLANAQSSLSIAKVNLMQLMEMPVSGNFEVIVPDVDSLLTADADIEPLGIYQKALTFMPQIKQMNLNVESANLDENIAKADRLPSLTLGAGVSTAWSAENQDIAYFDQVYNKVNPYIGLSLSIPIFSKNKVKSAIHIAKISAQTTQCEAKETKNELRKEVEQAVLDVATSQARYDASTEQYDAVTESFLVASEKFDTGLISSTDYLTEKTKQITAQSDLLQSKYTLLFSLKILDYYKGIPISLSK